VRRVRGDGAHGRTRRCVTTWKSLWLSTEGATVYYGCGSSDWAEDTAARFEMARIVCPLRNAEPPTGDSPHLGEYNRGTPRRGAVVGPCCRESDVIPCGVTTQDDQALNQALILEVCLFMAEDRPVDRPENHPEPVR
jgi:hypothetical protein